MRNAISYIALHRLHTREKKQKQKENPHPSVVAVKNRE
jgi:hypothetical protein